jgi:beta-lactamase class A
MAGRQQLVDQALATALNKFAPIHLRAEELAVTLVDLSGEKKSSPASHRGDAPFYPASVVKMFYLAAAHRWLEDKKISDTLELRRALHDMIVHSGNEATGQVLDVLTDTTSGPELPPAELAAWHEKRNVVNRYFHALGYPEINANRKTWHDGPYGRDKQAVDQFTPARNSLTTNAVARLLVGIVTGRCVSKARCTEMLDLMRRDFASPQSTDYQGREFIGAGLPPNAKLWSKAGDMSTARHDVAIVELADGKKFVLVIFTTRPDSKEIIPEIARQIVAGF